MCVCACVCVSQFVYPFTCWWTFGYFQFFAIINKVVVNICVKLLCGHMISFFLDKFLEVEWLSVFNFFKKLTNGFLKTLYHFIFHQVAYEGFSSPICWPTFPVVSLFNFSSRTGIQWHVIIVVIFISLMNYNIEQFFMCSFALCISYLWSMCWNPHPIKRIFFSYWI